MIRQLQRALLAAALLAPPVICPVTAAEDELDSVLSGFDEVAPGSANDEVLAGFDDELSPDPVAADTFSLSGDVWRLTGDIWLSSAWNYAHQKPPPGETDWRGLSQLRLNVRPELRLDLPGGWEANVRVNGFYDAAYQINNRSDYTSQVLRHYESELEFQDTFVRGSLGTHVDAKLGRQIVVWGKSDNLRVVDVLNPLDRREPGATDIENLRLPVTMSRLDFYEGAWNLSLLALHEIRFDKLPVYGSDFYPYDVPPPPEHVPHDGGSSTEYALALSAAMSGWDISFHAARIFDDEAHIRVDEGRLQRSHARVDMTGLAANVVLADWLLKAEVAHFDGLQFTAAPDRDFRRSDVLVGVDYHGFDNTTLTLETAIRHLHRYDDRLQGGIAPEIQRNRVETAFRYSADFNHQLWQVVLVATRLGESLNEGGITRAQLSYELQQALELTVGVVAYHGGRQWPFDAIADNDRLFVRLQYSF